MVNFDFLKRLFKIFNKDIAVYVSIIEEEKIGLKTGRFV
jgi:hypothetical protein